jgi:hypothetical protein
MLPRSPEELRYPPGADLPDEEQAIANQEPVVKPYRIQLSQMQQAKATVRRSTVRFERVSR